MMRKKFLKAVLIRATDKIMLDENPNEVVVIHQAAMELLKAPDAIDDQAQAHGEGRIQKWR